MFMQVVLSGWVVMTLYVSWRASSVPFVAARLPRCVVLVVVTLLGLCAGLAFGVRRAGWPHLASILELVGVHSIGTLFLLFVALLVADLVTGFGLIFRRFVPTIRACALAAGAALAVIAVVQGLRAPAVRDYEIELAGLPRQRDGTTIVFVSDLHLGTLVGKGWLDARIDQVAALHPDAVVIGGDVLEGDDDSEAALLPALGRLSAPLGVWSVAGNHERHGGGQTVQALRTEGIGVLRNEWRPLGSGLVLAGVEYARTHGASQGDGSEVDAALVGRPPGGATIVVSHMPSHVDRVARSGAGLMLSGHTHDGQIWPFRYIVRFEFPYLAGRYDVGGMPLLVCRGTGTFGPRMRLWYRSEILRIRLRAPGASAGVRPVNGV